MQVTENNVWACRSAWQKFFRRRDIGGMKACIDMIYAYGDVKHIDWLKVRAPVLIVEDCWLYAGELAKFQKETEQLSTTSKEYRKKFTQFMLRATAMPKQKDACGLTWYGQAEPEAGAHKEHICYHALFTFLTTHLGNNPALFRFSGDILEYCAKYLGGRKLSVYENEAMRSCFARMNPIGYKGMWDDKICALAAIVVIYSRGLDEQKIQNYLKTALADPKVTRTAKNDYSDGLPWYAYDKHTRIGIWATKAVIDLSNPAKLSIQELEKLQFVCSSALASCVTEPGWMPWNSMHAKNTLTRLFGDPAKAVGLWEDTYKKPVMDNINRLVARSTMRSAERSKSK